MDALKIIDPDKLSVAERKVLKSWCGSMLQLLGAESGSEEDSKKESEKERKEEEPKEKVKAESSWTPEQPDYVFVGTGDAKWPTGKGESRRERDLKRRKEQS